VRRLGAFGSVSGTANEPVTSSFAPTPSWRCKDAHANGAQTPNARRNPSRPALSRRLHGYNQPDAVLDPRAVEITTAMRWIATEWGEPFISLFTPEQFDELLRRRGFNEVRHFGADEAQARYFDGRREIEIAGAQRLATARVPGFTR
jgi:hypothetical protein